MPSEDELHRRLDALRTRLDETRKRAETRAHWHDGHRLTAGELAARHAYLKSELERGTKDLEAHGHRVRSLEESLGEWLESLNLSTG